jgi:hypothetical protein
MSKQHMQCQPRRLDALRAAHDPGECRAATATEHLVTHLSVAVARRMDFSALDCLMPPESPLLGVTSG